MMEIHTDGVGLVGWVPECWEDAQGFAGFIEAWCDWEWEDIGLCRPLAA